MTNPSPLFTAGPRKPLNGPQLFQPNARSETYHSEHLTRTEGRLGKLTYKKYTRVDPEKQNTYQEGLLVAN